MDKMKVKSDDNLSRHLRRIVESYTEFVRKELQDAAFLKELEKILPFDRMVQASRKVEENRVRIRKMGVLIMRMDITPPLYSLAVNIIFEELDGEIKENTIFVIACKTIEELQLLVTTEKFKKEVLRLCKERVSDKENILME